MKQNIVSKERRAERGGGLGLKKATHLSLCQTFNLTFSSLPKWAQKGLTVCFLITQKPTNVVNININTGTLPSPITHHLLTTKHYVPLHCIQSSEVLFVLPELSETVSFSHDTTVT